MTLKVYLKIMIIAVSFCWGAWIFVLNTIDPVQTNWLGFTLFYLSLFLSLIGTSAIIGFLIRFVGLKHELAFRSVKVAFRQSFLFAFLIVASLFLSAHNLLTWLNLALLIIGLTVLEYFLINYASTDLRRDVYQYNLEGEEK